MKNGSVRGLLFVDPSAVFPFPKHSGPSHQAKEHKAEIKNERVDKVPLRALRQRPAQNNYFNCQPVFSLGLSHHIRKMTNL